MRRSGPGSSSASAGDDNGDDSDDDDNDDDDDDDDDVSMDHHVNSLAVNSQQLSPGSTNLVSMSKRRVDRWGGQIIIMMMMMMIMMMTGLGSVRIKRTHTSSPDSKPAGRGETPETWRRGQENQNLLIVIPLF